MQGIELLTLPEVVKVLPFIAVQTIRKWIAALIFLPRVLGGLGPGQGHKLDKWDLLTVAVLHCLLASGLRFKHIQEGGVPFMPAHAWFKTTFRGASPDGQEVTIVDAADWETLGERPMQRYLEMHEGEVIVAVHFLDVRQAQRSSAEMAIVPMTGGDLFFDDVKDRDALPGRYVFINCASWASYIDRKFKEIG